MSILGWIVLGALAGWAASLITGRREGAGCITNIVIGIVGAFIGSFVMNFIGGAGVTGFNIYSFVVAVIGAVILLIITGLFQR
jgi:uncharacterized membrane protein YeaQ/YmgE (transglycosylase-associated protein family)